MDDLTPAMKQLAKDLMIDALRRHNTKERPMTRGQVRDAWKWIERLDGPGERI